MNRARDTVITAMASSVSRECHQALPRKSPAKHKTLLARSVRGKSETLERPPVSRNIRQMQAANVQLKNGLRRGRHSDIHVPSCPSLGPIVRTALKSIDTLVEGV